MNVGEFVSHNKVPLAIGAGGLVLFFVLRGRGAPAVAAQAPAEGVPTQTVAPAAAAQDYGTTGKQASAISDQLAQQQVNEQAAASNLALLGAQQQLQFQGQQQQQQLAIGQQQVASAAEAVSYQYRVDRGYNPNKQGGLGGLLQQIGGIFGSATGAAQQFTGTVRAVQGAQQAVAQPLPTQVIRAPAQPTPLLGGQYPSAGQLYPTG